MDADAARAALDAVGDAATLADAADAFAEAYVAHGGAEADAARVFQSLAADGFGAPDPLVAHIVPSRLAAPAPPARALGPLPLADRIAVDLPAVGIASRHQAVPTGAVRRATSQPRAP